MDHAFVGLVIQVDEVFFEFRGERGGVNRVPVVLRSDVALASEEI